ncbi:unnamed protein product [Bemisia tabaci]|uniref:Ankyrin repeat domain-containing protein 33B n=1 Tax=Bemisia tabaci TaxID=7038 RepID=A0A9P0G5C8_BEMTA|nr:unnamed protein product [Bemisia tabaci]
MYGPSKFCFKVSDKLKNENSNSNSMRNMVVSRSSPQPAFRHAMSPTMRTHPGVPSYTGYAQRGTGPLRVTIYEDVPPMMKVKLNSHQVSRYDTRDDSAILNRYTEDVPILRKYGRSHSTHELIDLEDRAAVTSSPNRRVRFDIPDESVPCPTIHWKDCDLVNFRALPVDDSPLTACDKLQNSDLPSNATPFDPAALLKTLIGDQTILKCAKEGRYDILQELVALGQFQTEDINSVDSSGRTALSYVAANGSVRALEDLLNVPGIDVNKPDNEGNTPLHFAAQAGQVEVLNFLLCRCSDIEIDPRNNLGFTPLMKAALQGRTKCAKLLLCAGASPIMRDSGRGLRAEQWARFCGRYVCAEVIEKFARSRLLERTTAYGRWGSDSDLGPRLVNGKLQPPAVVLQAQPPPATTSIKSKLRKAFRTTSHPGSVQTPGNFSLVTQLTSAALCASTPVLPSSTKVPPLVKSLIRPLTVPKVQITAVGEAPPPMADASRSPAPRHPSPSPGGAKLKKKK